MIRDSHPSSFALDELRLGLPVSNEINLHVASCTECKNRLVRTPIAPPAWLADLRPVRPLRPLQRRSVRFAFASALAAAIVLLTLWIAPPSSIYIATKGPPTITVFVKQNERVARWDGRTPVKPGDSLRLQIGPNDYHHASIALLNTAQEPGKVLWSGPLPADGALLLPVSFRVDEQGTEEILSLVMGHNPISPNLHRKPDDSPSETTTWRQILVIPKSALPEKSSP